MALTISDQLLQEAGFSELEARVEIACRLYDAGTWTLVILLRAKREGLCAAIRPLLDRLQREIHFFGSANPRQQILKRAKVVSRCQ